MVDDGIAMDILYLDAYKRVRLDENVLSLATSLLYRFTRDHIILKGTTKLAVTVEEHPEHQFPLGRLPVAYKQDNPEIILESFEGSNLNLPPHREVSHR